MTTIHDFFCCAVHERGGNEDARFVNARLSRATCIVIGAFELDVLQVQVQDIGLVGYKASCC